MSSRHDRFRPAGAAVRRGSLDCLAVGALAGSAVATCLFLGIFIAVAI